jgi:hypothetical protein
MWRHLNGVQPPAKKQKLGLEEKQARDRQYEKKGRFRGYLPQWEREFVWLEFSTSDGHMIYKVCRTLYHGTQSVDSTGVFVTGCKNFKKEALTKHGNSESHKKASDTATAKTAKVGTTPAEKMICTLNKQTYNRLCYMFRTCQCLSKAC